MRFFTVVLRLAISERRLSSSEVLGWQGEWNAEKEGTDTSTTLSAIGLNLEGK